MKYIMFQDENGQKLPVIFPDLMVHQYVAAAIERTMGRQKLYIAPTSAGFIRFDNVKVFGESETLGLKSKDIDADYIALGPAAAFMPENLVKMTIAKLKDRR